MSSVDGPETIRREAERALLLTHLLLAACLLTWRALRATPALAEGFAPSLAGQISLAATIVLCALALGRVLLETVRRPGARALALAALCAASFARRGSFDVFDLVYLLAAGALALPGALAPRPAAPVEVH